MDLEKMQRELRWLKTYALCSTLMLTAIVVLAARAPGKHTKFDQIDAERINIVESDGTIRFTIANHERMPGGRMAGVELHSRDGNRVMMKDGPKDAGMIFFNDAGDEMGGFVYGSKTVDGRPIENVGLTFDHYERNEAIAISDLTGVSCTR